MAEVERESNNSDQIQLTNTSKKDIENRGLKNVRKINSKKQKRRRSSTCTSSSSSSPSSSSSNDEKRKSKKKRKRRKKTRSFPTQGKESDKSDKMENQQPSKRFTILNQDNQFKWVLPDDILKNINSHFNQYIQEQDLKKSILTENPEKKPLKESNQASVICLRHNT